MRFLYLPILLILFAACTFRDQQDEGNFRVLPTPKSMKITGVSELSYARVFPEYETLKERYITGQDLPGESELIKIQIDPSMELNEEGYTLDISLDQVYIAAAAKKGIWSGLMTLGQILEDAQDQSVNLPLVNILDQPSLKYRAIHLDVKHHLETTEYYFELMDFLSSYKINGVIMEIEDKLRYEKQPLVGSTDALSINQWKEISDYALARNIRISPLVQGLGHASFILKHEEYKQLRDDPNSDWAFDPLNPETYNVQFDLYDDALSAFPHGRYLHVGGDEVHTTGRGSGRSSLELQLEWLGKVSQYAADHDRTPIFWDDMPLKHANVMGPIYNTTMSEAQVDSIWQVNEPLLNKFIDRFPKNCVYMRWNYSHPETYGNARAMEWFAKNGFQVMGATAGQTRWKLMPQNESNIDNIRRFALTSIDKKADGLLLTLWDDDSPHFQLYKRGILAFAEYTWAGDAQSKEEYKRMYRHRMFGSSVAEDQYAFIDDLEVPVAFWNNALLKSRDRNRLRDLDDPQQEAVLDLPVGDGEWSRQYEDRLSAAKMHISSIDTVLSRLDMLEGKARRNHHTLEVYRAAAQMTRFAPHALITLEHFDKAGPDQVTIAREQVLDLPRDFSEIQSSLLKAYGKTRKLNKPADYVLDQDHHVHLANQALNYEDWQFYVEQMFARKIKEQFVD